uniref:Uncharacterized protein n=1 Tax=Glossina palpalis gambiensis TaxID=67801 RepID=A0A1B0C5G8_9MUSC
MYVGEYNPSITSDSSVGSAFSLPLVTVHPPAENVLYTINNAACIEELMTLRRAEASCSTNINGSRSIVAD